MQIDLSEMSSRIYQCSTSRDCTSFGHADKRANDKLPKAKGRDLEDTAALSGLLLAMSHDGCGPSAWFKTCLWILFLVHHSRGRLWTNGIGRPGGNQSGCSPALGGVAAPSLACIFWRCPLSSSWVPSGEGSLRQTRCLCALILGARQADSLWSNPRLGLSGFGAIQPHVGITPLHYTPLHVALRMSARCGWRVRLKALPQRMLRKAEDALGRGDFGNPPRFLVAPVAKGPLGPLLKTQLQWP